MKAIAILASMLLLACQAEPFVPAATGADQPFQSGFPRRLTYNLGDDRTPSWLPDGSAIIYSSEREDRPDHDRCLALIAPGGGTLLWRYCPTAPVEDDSTNLMESPAVSADGRIFYHRVTSWIGQQKLGESAMMLGRATDPVSARRIQWLPYTASNGRIHYSIRLPAWTGPDHLVYLAELLFYEGSTFYPDTVYTGEDVMQADLSGATPVLTPVPGTDYASSVAVAADPDTIYYTLGGDSVVYARSLGGGGVTPVYNFGSGNIVRDAQVRNGVLVAVVGGSVGWQYETNHGWVQRDEGGDLYFVSLGTGAISVVLGDSVLYRHPQISPDGKYVVVEVQPWAPVHLGPQVDYTATNHRADLWLFEMP